jgi:3-methylfumaryl-CoA hydratase
VSLSLEDLAVPARTEAFLDPHHVHRIQATLDQPPTLHGGDALPLLWHWMFFVPVARTRDLGSDGHPRTSPRVPPQVRRMWAGGRVEVARPLLIGREASCATELESERTVEGRSGQLLVVTLRHLYLQEDVVAITEEQTLVYRDSTSNPMARPVPGDHEPSGGSWVSSHRVDEQALFRFSALTFNAHRIHYDRPYAQSVEGYPDLVVHGPLIAVLAAQDLAACGGRSGREISEFRFRLTAPLFAGQTFWVQGDVGQGETALRVIRADGVESCTATAAHRGGSLAT